MVTENSLINIDKDDLNIPIYRIIPRERLKQLFKNEKNVLVQPKEWKDPFENFILKSKFKASDETVATVHFCDSYYGQCWSLKEESDAMWRIYSPKKNGVMIKTTIGKLIEGLLSSQSNNTHKDNICFIGKVKYLTYDELKKSANNALKCPNSFKEKNYAKTFFFKRESFSHEEEVRIIYSDYSNDYDNNKKTLFSYSFNPHEVLEQLVFDPRLTEKKFNCSKLWFAQKENFKGSIEQSSLYDYPQDMIFDFGE